MSNYEKKRIALRYFLLGRKYYSALKAMDYAEGLHNGLRKDGVTPEFQHQVEQVLFAKAFEPYYLNPEVVYTVIFLHDVLEDKCVTYIDTVNRFGLQVAKCVANLTNKWIDSNAKKTGDSYYTNIGDDSVASMIKGFDRIHNQQSMTGVFSLEKQKSYIEETECFILPMLKRSRESFPEQEPVYESIKYVLESQIQFAKYIIDGSIKNVSTQGKDTGKLSDHFH